MALMQVTEFKSEKMYPNESISFLISRKDKSMFPITGTLELEVYNETGELIDTKPYLLEVDKLSFKILYTNTNTWIRGAKYTLWARYKDTSTDYNNVVTDIAIVVK